MVHVARMARPRWAGLLACLLMLMSPTACGPVSPTPAVEERTRWLRESAIPIRSIAPADEQFSDLQPLKEVFGDAQIILLGEISHGDGNTFLAKTRLIKFLHQEMGFDVLAFESGLYDCAKAWDLILSGERVKTAVQKAIFSIWGISEQVQPLLAYIGEMASSEHPLEVAGFDSAFTGTASSTYLIADLEAFLEGRGLLGRGRAGWAEFVTILDDLTHAAYQSGGKLPPYDSEREEFLDTLAGVRFDIETTADPVDREAAFWLQVLESTETHAVYLWQVYDSHRLIEYSEKRDAQMGRNLLWLADGYFPGRKIVVWAATIHIARNLDSLEAVEAVEPESPPRPEVMGDVVFDALGDQIYALGFTASTGSSGVVFKPAHDLAEVSEGSFEDLMNRAGFEYAIVDFRHIPAGGDWLREGMISRPFGYVEERGDWPKVLDGLMYIREMIPSQGSIE